MKERLKSNLGLKLLSVFLAFFLWLLVVNVSNPQQTASQTVQLDIINEDALTGAGLTYEIVGRSNVTIRYKVHMTNRSLISASDFRAYIDLSDCNVLGTVPVTVEVLNHSNLVEDVEVDPMVVHVETEPLQEKEFTVRAIFNGEVAEGYDINSYEVNPETVTVRGPESLVGQITSVGIEINDIEGATEDVVGTAVPQFYDANGNPLNLGERVTVDQEEIEYSVQVLKVRYLALDFQVSGQVADGYRFTGVQCDVQTIPVVGLKSQLASVTSVTIPSDVLNIDGLSATKTVSVDISQYLPDGVHMVTEDNNTTIEIHLEVEPLTERTFTLNTSLITLTGQDPQYEYEFADESLTVTVQGLSEDLASLDAGQITVSSDVSGFEPGEEHLLELTFGELGSGYQITAYSNVHIRVYDQEEIAGPGAVIDEETEESSAAETTAQDGDEITENREVSHGTSQSNN